MRSLHVLVATLLLVPLTLVPTASATAPQVSVTMDAARYSLAGIATNGSPLATVVVTDETGAPLANVEVRLQFIRMVPVFGFGPNETVMLVTDENGVATARAPTASSLPGDYFTMASVSGALAGARYTVGA